jgi:hypothetical protein
MIYPCVPCAGYTEPFCLDGLQKQKREYDDLSQRRNPQKNSRTKQMTGIKTQNKSLLKDSGKEILI